VIILSDIKVSIIISIYKVEKYLRRAIESVISQSETAIEIILVNDGSPDHCGKIADEYAKRDNRIKVIHKANGGVASARNCGLEIGEGKYIIFVDADDWIDTNYVEVLLNKAVTSNADIVRCNVCYEYECGASKIMVNDFSDNLFIEKKEFKGYIYKKMISGIQMNSVWRTLYKKEILEGVRFDENLKTCEDLLFSMEAYTNAQRFAYTAQPLYHYFQGHGGLTGSGLSVITKFKCNFYISRLLTTYIKTWDIDSIINLILIYKRLFNITFSKSQRCVKSLLNTSRGLYESNSQ
jgi:glycosyltransferase involved in cell wall biosynthesis